MIRDKIKDILLWILGLVVALIVILYLGSDFDAKEFKTNLLEIEGVVSNQPQLSTPSNGGTALYVEVNCTVNQECIDTKVRFSSITLSLLKKNGFSKNMINKGDSIRVLVGAGAWIYEASLNSEQLFTVNDFLSYRTKDSFYVYIIWFGLVIYFLYYRLFPALPRPRGNPR